MTERAILCCPHCTLQVRPCDHNHPIPLEDALLPRCEGYVHVFNGQHACNPASPVYVAERPREVRKDW